MAAPGNDSPIEINGESYERLADGEYDAIVLGTGLTECVISGILSVAGLRVLHCDRNNYYGGSCASLNLKQMFETLKGANGKEVPDSAPQIDLESLERNFGSNRDYNIDLIPKFIMAGGNMVNLLVYTDVTKYLDFKLVDGSFVYTAGRPHKVPTTPREAVTSGLLGLLEKNRCRSFFSFVNAYEKNDPSSHHGLDLAKMTMKEVYTYYNLQPDTIGFIGHALALYTDDSYMDLPAEPTIARIQLYAQSLARHGNSPYLYPLYGLGELPQAFARLAAVHGGTYMLDTSIDEILYNDNNDKNEIIGIKSNGKVAKCKFIVSDPSYFPEKSKLIGKVIRKYCILNEPPPNTRESSSCQVIIPARQISPTRQSDIYVLVLSDKHKTTPSGKYLALVSTTVESEAPEKEVQPGVDLLGEIVESFISIDNIYEPLVDGREDKVYITKSYDATTHFETTVDDVFDVYERIFDKPLVLGSGSPTSSSNSASASQ